MSYLGDHGDSEDEHEYDHEGGEHEPARPQVLGPVVDKADDEGLEDAELRVEAEREQHHEEEDRPEGRGAQLEHDLQKGQRSSFRKVISKGGEGLTSGKTRKARPGPDLTTSPMPTPFSLAMNPRMEKMMIAA